MATSGKREPQAAERSILQSKPGGEWKFTVESAG